MSAGRSVGSNRLRADACGRCTRLATPALGFYDLEQGRDRAEIDKAEEFTRNTSLVALASHSCEPADDIGQDLIHRSPPAVDALGNPQGPHRFVKRLGLDRPRKLDLFIGRQQRDATDLTEVPAEGLIRSLRGCYLDISGHHVVAILCQDSPIVLSANSSDKYRFTHPIATVCSMAGKGATTERRRAMRPATTRTISRREAKQRTRKRLLGAARRLILAGGEGRVAASVVAQEAGVGGATFYEHFRNRDDVIRALSDSLFEELRDKLAKARREALAAPDDEEKLRQEFRTPVEVLAANPDLFRLALRVRHHAGSPLGESSRSLTGNTRKDLVNELVARGYPAATRAERRRLEMVADIHIAATEVLTLGYISGRYPDIDEVVEMLVLVTRGTRLTRAWRSAQL